jgi:hypothetical protein
MMDARTSITWTPSVHQPDVWRPLSGRQQSTRWTSNVHESDAQRPRLGRQKGVSIHHCTRRAGWHPAMAAFLIPWRRHRGAVAVPPWRREGCPYGPMHHNPKQAHPGRDAPAPLVQVARGRNHCRPGEYAERNAQFN